MFFERGTRKKKALTDRATLIPFSNQSLRKEGTSVSNNKEANQAKSIAPLNPKIEPKIISSPTGNLDSELISINQLLQKSREKKVSDVEFTQTSGKENQAFNIDSVKMLWKQFAFKMKENGLETIYVALTKRDPKIINETEIHQEFDNTVQVDMIQHHLMDLLSFMRSNLNNWSVQVFFDVIKSSDENTRLLTGKDKFNELAKKNTNLFSLQKTFNLDIDY